MKKWNWKAIFGGLAVDQLGGFLVAAILITPFLIVFASRGPKAPTQFSPPLLTFAVVLSGFTMKLLSGYLCTAWASHRKLAHATIMGGFSLGLGIFRDSLFSSSPTIWTNISWSMTLPMILLGAWWRVKTHGPESLPKAEKVPSPAAPIASPFED